ncbi:MAG: haloalkane dehalogenase [Anaerolinea sp.]|nr:haloalkane dehalogenase [Anaerolinea sp.]
MEVFRTPEERFAGLPGFPFAAHYRDVSVDGAHFRMHYIDEGDGANGVVLMVHGMPTWSYLYRRMIPPLVAAGYRCIAPDHLGFGKSDKALDDGWYSIERHSLALGSFIEGLGLERITLVCQDWGGPIGLRQAVDMPERFDRLAILNTWLHHQGFEYTAAIRRWQSLWQPGGAMDQAQGCGLVLKNFLMSFPHGAAPQLTPEQASQAYEAPFPDRASKAGPRRFPLSIPIDGQNPETAAQQQRCWDDLLSWTKPLHFIWGTADQVFTEAWGREWAARHSQSTFDALNAGHFLQETHGQEIAGVLLRRISANAGESN